MLDRREEKGADMKDPKNFVQGGKLLKLLLVFVLVVGLSPQISFADVESALSKTDAAQSQSQDADGAASVPSDAAETQASQDAPASSAASATSTETAGSATSVTAGSSNLTTGDTPVASAQADSGDGSASDLATLETAAQEAIDSLPDASTAGFAVTADTYDGYVSQLSSASDAIGAFVSAGGDDTQLDTTRYDALAAALTAYDDGGVVTASSYTGVITTDCPWFTVTNIQAAGVTDANFAQAIYDNVVGTSVDDGFYQDEGIQNAYVYEYYTEPLEITDYASILDYLESTTKTGVQKTAFLLNYYTGTIDASNKKIVSIEGITLLGDASIDLSYNKIESLEPLGVTDEEAPKLSRGVSFNNNPIHVYPSHIADVTGANGYSFSTSLHVFGKTPLRYHYGDKATAKVTLGVSNCTNKSYIWEVGDESSDVITSTGQTSVDALEISVDTIKGTVVSFGAQLSQNETISKGICIYYTNRPHNDDGGYDNTSATIQHNTMIYEYGCPTQLYATLKQDATVKVLGGFTFTKTNADKTKTLPGAVYTLKDADDNDVTTYYEVDEKGNKTEKPITEAMLTTGADGTISISGLPAGDYTLVEKTAPAGYKLDTNPISLTVEDATTTTAVDGGIKTFNKSADETTSEPDWSDSAASSSGIYVKALVGDLPEEAKVPTDYDKDASCFLTNKKMGAFTSNGIYNAKATATDYATINSLKAEITGTGSYTEKGTVTVSMIDASTGKSSVVGTYQKLADAKDYVNDLADKSKLTGDVTITSNTVYIEDNTTVTTEGDDLDATNTPLPVNLSFGATKTFEGGTLSGTTGDPGNFAFTVTGAGEDDATLTSPAYNDADGKVSFGDLTFTKAGKYTFTFKETAGGDTSITYDTTVHTVVVTVEEGTGGLSATVTIDGTSAGTYTGTGTNTVETDGSVTKNPADVSVGTFQNSKVKKETTLSIPVTKTVAGETPETYPTFTYTLSAVTTGAPMPDAAGSTCTTTGVGTASFGNITYDAVGEWDYTVTESVPAQVPTGWTYDKTPVQVHVSVTLKDGELVAAATYSKGTAAPTSAAFENKYTPNESSAQASPDVTKTITGGITEGTTIPDFAFTLTAAAGNPEDGCTGLAASATLFGTDLTKASGSSKTLSSAFGTATFTKAGTYTYTIAETAPDPLPVGWTYDSAAYTWTVVVSDHAGTLQVDSAALSKDGAAVDAATFTNALFTPAPGYTMSKTRVTAAPAKDRTDPSQYGFKHGDEVTYSVTIANTGNIDLTMDVADAFADVSYFSTPEATEVSGDGVTASTALPTTGAVSVSIPVGKTATVTYTATVAQDAPENLADAAADDGMGYLNTATTTDVKGTWTDSKGAGHTVTKTDYPTELGDKDSTAHTPVQVPVGSTVQADKTADKADVKPGDVVNYTIVVTNVSEDPVEGVWVKDYAPDGTTFVSCDESGTYGITADGRSYVNWFIPTLEGSGTATLSLTVRVDECPEGTAISNTALYEVTGTTAPPDFTKNPSGGSSTTAKSTVGSSTASAGGPAATRSATGSAKTGDATPVIPLALIAVAAGSGALCAVRRKAKRR